jgi:nicotinamide mononucleotide adenylyltransferase
MSRRTLEESRTEIKRIVLERMRKHEMPEIEVNYIERMLHMLVTEVWNDSAMQLLKEQYEAIGKNQKAWHEE